MRPIRILQTVFSMDIGGVETWLMHILRNIDREQYRLDFAVHLSGPGTHEEEIRALGSNIHVCAPLTRPWRQLPRFRRILREHGPYDIMHAHTPMLGPLLWLARRAGVPVRILHTHNDFSRRPPAGLLSRLYFSGALRLARRSLTHALACSEAAATGTFSSGWREDSRVQVLYCGEDFDAFEEPVDRAEVRREFDLPANAFVIGHVGRFARQKNHQFIIEIAREILPLDESIRFLLIGDGPLRGEIESAVDEAGLRANIRFAGNRRDVPRLLKGAVDVFLLPSLHEGLGLVLIEAQAAGLPAVFADSITPEADVVPELATRLSLSLPPDAWAQAILRVKQTPPTVSGETALAALRGSHFAVEQSVSALGGLYTSATGSAANE